MSGMLVDTRVGTGIGSNSVTLSTEDCIAKMIESVPPHNQQMAVSNQLENMLLDQSRKQSLERG